MVISLESAILGGYLSNEVQGSITGQIHLAGQKRPLRIELDGNFLRDIAGCRVDFLNPLPDSDGDLCRSLSLTQNGQAGVMTASHRAGRLPRRRLAGMQPMAEPPGLKNLVFLEWFNQDGQRVLIQSWHLQLRVSAPQWRLSKDGETAQLRQNRARRKHFLLNRNRPPSTKGRRDVPKDEGLSLPPVTSDDSFTATDTLPPPGSKGEKRPSVQRARRSADLALELRRFEMLMQSTTGAGEMRPTVLQLLTSVSDLAAHLGHALKQFASGGRSQWHFLIVDLEQSLPVFTAGVNACDRLMKQIPTGADSKWLGTLHRCLLSVELRMRELLMLLRE